MSMPEFKKLMNHTIVLKKLKRNESGDFSIISSSTIKGHVEYGNHLIEKSKDEKIMCTAIVFLLDNCGIDINHENWKIDQTLPYNRPNMEVVKIYPVDDPQTGNTHHYECFCK
jgi:hypothetical protein